MRRKVCSSQVPSQYTVMAQKGYGLQLANTLQLSAMIVADGGIQCLRQPCTQLDPTLYAQWLPI